MHSTNRHRRSRQPRTLRHLTLLARMFALLGLATAMVPVQARAQESAARGEDPVLEVYRADWESVSEKIVGLAEAIPEEAYDWRPAEKVRSVGEVVVHVAGPNLFLTRALVGEMEADNPLDELGEEATKQERIDALKFSIARVDRLLDKVDAADLEGRYQAFGREMTGYRILHILMTHSHEHLGQLIAYARSNGVTPPWSG